MPTLNEPLLDSLLTQLEQARPWSARVISKLETWLRADDDAVLFRADPLQFAREKNVPEAEAIDLFLHAAKLGLFVMEWHLVCASCGSVVESFRQLSNLHAHFVCRVCSTINTANLDDFIRVGFTLLEAVRSLKFHHPERLTIEELYLDYHLSRQILPYPDGRHLRTILLEAGRIMSYLEPGETRSFTITAHPGVLHATNEMAISAVAYAVGEAESGEPQRVRLVVDAGKFCPVDTPASPLHMPTPVGFISAVDHFGQLLRGPVTCEIENRSPQRAAVWMIHIDHTFPTAPPPYAPFLSGKRLLSTQTFRDLFRAETISATEGLNIREITFLFTDLKGSTEMYEQIGDPQAFFLVRQHFDLLGQIVAQQGGAVVKTIGDAVMATFLTPRDALRAALAMNHAITTFNQNHAAHLVLKIGLHHGHSIAVTLNERLDYFGQTVNIAARVQALAGAGEICLTDDVYTAPDVPGALAGCIVQAEQAALKGVSVPMTVWRVKAV